MMNVDIRPEQASDQQAIHAVNQAAFGRAGEGDLVDALRKSGELRVSLVADVDGQVVGHIAFSPVTLDAMHNPDGALGLGPMAMLPEYQARGIGLKLIEAGLLACREQGAEIVVVLGHPDYYPRAGFRPAHKNGISVEFPVPQEVFMVLELQPGTLMSYQGEVRYAPIFREVT